MKPTATGLEEPRTENKSRRVRLGRLIGWGCVLLAVGAGALVWSWNASHPRSESATISAPVVGIAPRVSGVISRLPIRNNDLVPAGDILFEIDSEPYRLAEEAAAANLAAIEGELVNVKRSIAAQEQQVIAAEAVLKKSQTARDEAAETYQRLAPLLAKRYVTPESVDTARRAKESAEFGVAAAEAELLSARASVADPAPLVARRLAAVANLELAKLAVRDCTVRAPFDARVAGMHLAAGAFARVGVDCFVLIDTTRWEVEATFREGDLRHIRPGQPAEVELLTARGKTFRGEVESLGWGVTPLPTDPFPGLPIVPRQLDWVQLAQKFPVTIRLPSDIPPEFLRVGATASVTILPGK